VHAEHAVEATNVPLQKLSIIAELSPERSYCIAIRVPRGSVEDCFIYDTADEYKYVRLTACDEKDDYLIVGGCDHAVGQEPASAERFQELETWTRERIQEPVDFVAYIGKNPGQERVYIVTGDSGDGLTHGVLAGRLIADEIDGKQNDWASLYSPKRLGSIIKTLPSMIKHDVQINLQYARLLSTDIEDIGQLGLGCGALLNTVSI
jgi:glycine/D-amino acid oxidase-like deaminating enzyme